MTLHRARPERIPRSAPDVPPVRIHEIELNAPIPPLEPGPARLLMRLDGRPVAFLPARIPPPTSRDGQLADLLRLELDELALPAPLAASASATLTVSVVVTACTAGPELTRTLRSIEAQTRRPDQFIVVDNRPATSGVAQLLAEEGFPDVTLIREPVPGLSNARNAGLAAVRSDIVVFTDDDVVPDPGWVEALVSGFTDPDIVCVTGLILPLELETVAQCWFEEYGGFCKGFRRRRFDLGENRPPERLYPFRAGLFGSGANAAFRTADFRALGGFDRRLGTGTPARGGEDLDVYLTIIQAGRALVYEPAALLRHEHHRDAADLRKQIHGYGVGLAAMLTKRWAAHPQERWQILCRLGTGMRYLLDPRSAKNRKKGRGYPLILTIAELAGIVRGPFAYWRSTVRSRRQKIPMENSD